MKKATQNNIELFLDKYWKYLLIGVFVIATILRIIGISRLNFWRDEAFTAILAQKSFGDIINISINDYHPPLHTLFMGVLERVFGPSELTFRLPSVVFSVLTLWYLYLFIKPRFNKVNQLAILLLYAFSMVSIYYAQEARSYALITFLFMGSVYHLGELLKGKKGWDLILFVLYNVIAVYSHDLALLILAAQGLFVLITVVTHTDFKLKQIWKELTQWLLPFGLVTVFISPWLVAFVEQLFRANEGFWLTFNPEIDFQNTVSQLIKGTNLFTWDYLGLIFWVFELSVGLVLFAGVIKFMKDKKDFKYLYNFWGVLVLFYLVSFLRPVLYVRYVSFVIPFLPICMVLGLNYIIKSKLIRKVILIFWIEMYLAIYGIYLTDVDAKPDATGLLEFVAENSTVNSRVVHFNSLSFFPYEYYYDNSGLPSNIKATIFDLYDQTPHHVGKALMVEEDFTRELSGVLDSDILWVIDFAWETDKTVLEPYFYFSEEYEFAGGLTLEKWIRIN